MTSLASRALRRGSPAALSLLALCPLVVEGCKSETPPEPPARAEVTSEGSSTPTKLASSAAARARPVGGPRAKTTARPVASVPVSEDDPLHGQFSLADATRDLKGVGALLADVEVELPVKGGKGDAVKLTCALFEDRAPLTVANFVGLARGLRPWKSAEREWVKRPAYDKTTFHRIIKGFMIQGGDAAGTGAGEPGYVVPDEVWEGGDHDRPGLLCMANRGKNTNGAQFFITDGPAAHLDGGYTIFGECAPLDAVRKIATVEVKGERPVNPPKIKHVGIRRGQSPVAAPSGAPGAPPAASTAAVPATPADTRPAAAATKG